MLADTLSQDDVDDLRAVILFLRERYNYSIELIVGHSRGSIVGWAYYARFAEAMRVDPEEDIPLWASVAGRWRMAGIHKRDAEFNAGFAKEGVYRWKVRVAGQDREVIVRPEDVEAFAKFPMEETVRNFPADTDWYFG
jgi:pimeloyl-ACP methyl ester carboxylesterase